MQQLHAGVISFRAFAHIWLILLNPVTIKEVYRNRFLSSSIIVLSKLSNSFDCWSCNDLSITNVTLPLEERNGFSTRY